MLGYTLTPPPRGQNDRHLWKHYLSATTVADGKYCLIWCQVKLRKIVLSDWLMMYPILLLLILKQRHFSRHRLERRTSFVTNYCFQWVNNLFILCPFVRVYSLSFQTWVFFVTNSSHERFPSQSFSLRYLCQGIWSIIFHNRYFTKWSLSK